MDFVESRSGAPRAGLGPSVAVPFGDGALSGLNHRTFPDPARQTGHAMPPEAPRHSLELLGSRQSPGLGFFVHCFGTKAPSLHRSYPASSVLRAYPPSQPALSDPRGLQVATPYGASTGRDFPCCDGSPVANMPSSMPRQTVVRRISLVPCGLAAFPMCWRGRRLH